MDLINQKKYVFTQAYKHAEGIIPEGSELIYFRGMYSLNGGLLPPAYQSLFEHLMTNTRFNENYLQEVRIINNKV